MRADVDFETGEKESTLLQSFPTPRKSTMGTHRNLRGRIRRTTRGTRGRSPRHGRRSSRRSPSISRSSAVKPPRTHRGLHTRVEGRVTLRFQLINNAAPQGEKNFHFCGGEIRFSPTALVLCQNCPMESAMFCFDPRLRSSEHGTGQTPSLAIQL